MDTKFFQEALEEFAPKRVSDLTGQQLSHVLRRAQQLKDAAGAHGMTRTAHPRSSLAFQSIDSV